MFVVPFVGLAISGNILLDTTSVSPASASNTNALNPMSNQPQVGIESKKDIGFCIFGICCWGIAGAMIILATIRLLRKDQIHKGHFS